MGSSFVIAFSLALVLGIIAARRPNSRLDAAINLFCFAGVSVPTFWLALVLILIFAAGLGWLPASGVASAGTSEVGDRLRHLVLPVATLSLATAGGYTRYVRAAMREALAQDHIRTARAKGAGEARVVFRHALRSALVAVPAELTGTPRVVQSFPPRTTAIKILSSPILMFGELPLAGAVKAPALVPYRFGKLSAIQLATPTAPAPPLKALIRDWPSPPTQ